MRKVGCGVGQVRSSQPRVRASATPMRGCATASRLGARNLTAACLPQATPVCGNGVGWKIPSHPIPSPPRGRLVPRPQPVLDFQRWPPSPSSAREDDLGVAYCAVVKHGAVAIRHDKIVRTVGGACASAELGRVNGNGKHQSARE
jgi:hypothetical protein